MGGSAGRLVATRLALPVLVLVLVLAGQRPAGAAFEDPDADTTAEYYYDVDEEAGLVRVSIDLAFTADKPDVATADGVFQYFYDGYSLVVPPEATELTVVDQSGVTLNHERESLDEYSDLLTIDFRRNVFYRQTLRLTVSYDLPPGAPGSDGLVRVNPAQISFEAWVSPNIEEAEVRVELPDGYVDESEADTVRFRVEDGQAAERELVTGAVDPEEFYALVSLTNDAELDLQIIDLATVLADDDLTGEVHIQSWPDDEGWEDHVEEGVVDGLPILHDLVGLEWPIDDELVIIESFSPVLHGYAGWYDRSTDIIEVSDVRDDHLLYHELSHVWFHDGLFVDRWVSEGLAEVYSAETVAALGQTRPQPMPTTRRDSGAIALEDFDGLLTPEEEAWGYQASWTLMEAVVDEIGLDGLTQVVADADEGHLAYVGDADPEPHGPVADWRRLLDLAENQQQVASGPLAELFQTWIPDSPANDRFTDRAEARGLYFDLVAGGDGWAAPVGVRRLLTSWDFSRARDLMAEAEVALDGRDEVAALVAPTGATLPPELETTYEAVENDFTGFTTELAQARAAGQDVLDAHERIEADRSILTRIGLLGADPEADQALAVAAFSEGRAMEASATAAEVEDLFDRADNRALIRLAIGLGLTLVLAVAAWVLLARRSRTRPATVGSDSTATQPMPTALDPTALDPTAPMPQGAPTAPSTAPPVAAPTGQLPDVDRMPPNRPNQPLGPEGPATTGTFRPPTWAADTDRDEGRSGDPLSDAGRPPRPRGSD